MFAAVFINWTIPVGLGHVGWGFQASAANWYYGALETAGFMVWAGDDNHTFNQLGSFSRMISDMKTGRRDSGGGYPYHDYKLINVGQTDVGSALRLVANIKSNGYGLFRNNCMDATFNVVKSFARGNDRVLPWPSTHPIPRMWYSAIPGKGNFIQSESVTGNWMSQHGA